MSATGGAVGWVARKGTWAEGWRHHGHAGGEPFLGQWFDAESGLHYNRFRYYDPDTGRYLSPDPLGLGGDVNPYGRLRSPIEVNDRYGLSTDPSCGTKAPEEPQPIEPPTLTRQQALALAQQFAQVPRESNGGEPIPFSTLNDSSRGKNFSQLQQEVATNLGRSDPNSRAMFMDHTDGHPDLLGPDQSAHHQYPHVHAVNAKGEEAVFPYKR